MSNTRMEHEIKSLIKLGLNEDTAKLITFKKFGFNEVADDLIKKIKEEQFELSESINDMLFFNESIIKDSTPNIAINKNI